jgi:outer membrane receptor protein involved in Fe transport
MRSKALRFSASAAIAIAAAYAAPAWAQEAPQSGDTATEDSGEIIVTATLRNENLQDVPIAVSAYSGEALEKAGVRDVRSFESISPSFNSNSTQTESGGSTLRVRGVGTTGNNTGLESAVGIFLDGVYLSRPGVAMGDLLDVEQIELLRGPQGTLFGRNTTAGALNIKTKKPNLNEFEGYAVATYGNYDLKNIQAGISAPLADGKAGFRLSGAWRDRDGFLRNAVGGESNNRNRYVVRGQFIYEPSADLSVRIIGDYAKYNEKCCDAIIFRDTAYVNGLYASVGLPANGGAPFSGPQALADYRTSNNFELRDRQTQWGVSAQIDYDLGGVKLTSITGYRDVLSKSQQETEFVSVNVFSTSTGTSSATPNSAESFTAIKTFTQELRLAGSVADDKFDFLVGGYFAKEKINEIQSLTLGPDHVRYVSAPLASVGAPNSIANPALNTFTGGVSSSGATAANNFRQNATNFSIFTNNTLNVSDSFKLNFGLRYSDDKKKGLFDQISASNPACAAIVARTPLFAAGQPLAALGGLLPLARALTCFPFATPVGLFSTAPTEFSRTFKDNELIYTGKVLWEPADNINTYLSYSHGYKSGGFNLDPTAAAGGANPAFNSEKIDAWEVGFKSKWLDNAVTLNVAVFDQKMKDFQVLEFTGVQFVTFNVPKARSTGVEVETLIRPTRNLSFNAGVTYADARYPADCDGGVLNATVTLLCGQSLTNSSKWNVAAGFNWDQPVSDSMKFTLNGNVRMESDRRISTQGLLPVAAGTGDRSVLGGTNNAVIIPGGIQDGNAKINLRAAIGSADDKWSLEFWGNNIFDVRTRNVTFSTALRGVGTLPGPFNAGGIGVSRGSFVQEPRTYGVTGRIKF